MLLLLLACSSSPGTAPVATPPLPAGAHPPGGAPGAPPHPPPPGVGPGASGAILQDPSGFPPFHDQPSPSGPPPGAAGAWSAPEILAARPSGGYRPQVVVSADGTRHAVYYERLPAGDVVRYRSAPAGGGWGAPEAVSPEEGRNWGPDIVARADGSIVVAYDHAESDMSSQGWIRVRSSAGWAAPEAVTPKNGWEMGSGHVAPASRDGVRGDDLAYVYITKPLDPQRHFQAMWRWRTNGTWSQPAALTDGQADAWHSNVERRPDGSVLAGYDVGQGGMETTLYTVTGRDGALSPPEVMSPTSHPGERPNFAFGPDGTDYFTWFHKQNGVPTHVYVRAGRPGAWGATTEPSLGLGGFHFDPDLAIDAKGTLCLVWGWDAGGDAELVYSLSKASLSKDGARTWSAPRKVAEIDWGKPGLPSVDVGPDGRFHVVWNQGIRGSNEVYYATLDPG